MPWSSVYDPEVVFETLLLGTHHGNEADTSDAGDRVVAVAQTVGSGPVSQIAVEDQFAFVFTFAGERCVREQGFRNKEEALEAAGLRE